MISLTPGPRILVIALRRLGDVLLTTPLVRSLRRAWPDAQLDMLVFAETAAILQGNPDIDRVIAVPGRSGIGESLSLAAHLFRRYDLAVSTQSGDRPVLLAAAAGRITIAPDSARGAMGAFKRAILSRTVANSPGIHRVEEMLRIADALDVPRVGEVVCPVAEHRGERASDAYAVIHPAPMFQYKRWTRDGWRALAGALIARGLRVAVTGGPAASERDYIDDVFKTMQVERKDGVLSWPDISAMIARAAIFVGPDTSVTHLAAATGTPTVALFGPTDPRLWGPWPAGGLTQPWAARGTVQQRGNVWLVQYAQPCTPCQQEGCDRHLNSHSLCLDEMPVAAVMSAVDRALQHSGAAVAVSR